jgi:hypothetical protein
VLRLGGRTRPYFNLPISNVPGPPTPLYLDRAPLRDIHASTVLYHGQALNIVCVSYTDKLEFTFTACSSALQHIVGFDPLPGTLTRTNAALLAHTYRLMKRRTARTVMLRSWPVFFPTN